MASCAVKGEGEGQPSGATCGRPLFSADDDADLPHSLADQGARPLTVLSVVSKAKRPRQYKLHKVVSPARERGEVCRETRRVRGYVNRLRRCTSRGQGELTATGGWVRVPTRARASRGQGRARRPGSGPCPQLLVTRVRVGAHTATHEQADPGSRHPRPRCACSPAHPRTPLLPPPPITTTRRQPTRSLPCPTSPTCPSSRLCPLRPPLPSPARLT